MQDECNDEIRSSPSLMPGDRNVQSGGAAADQKQAALGVDNR